MLAAKLANRPYTPPKRKEEDQWRVGSASNRPVRIAPLASRPVPTLRRPAPTLRRPQESLQRPLSASEEATTEEGAIVDEEFTARSGETPPSTPAANPNEFRERPGREHPTGRARSSCRS
jgi:hypothetical protein